MKQAAGSVNAGSRGADCIIRSIYCTASLPPGQCSKQRCAKCRIVHEMQDLVVRNGFKNHLEHDRNRSGSVQTMKTARRLVENFSKSTLFNICDGSPL